jgi:CrcB protein
VNVLGSFVIGILGAMSLSGAFASAPDLRQFFMTGLCGGYTTFSSFTLQTLDLARNGDFVEAAGNVFLSLVLCLVAVALGYACGAMVVHAAS